MVRQRIAHLFQAELDRIFQESIRKGRSYVDVLSKDLHDCVIRSPYKPKDARMPSCCGVMRNKMGVDDAILSDPQKLQTSKLLIRYQLPRL